MDDPTPDDGADAAADLEDLAERQVAAEEAPDEADSEVEGFGVSGPGAKPGTLPPPKLDLGADLLGKLPPRGATPAPMDCPLNHDE